jgi:hypothetical protein
MSIGLELLLRLIILVLWGWVSLRVYYDARDRGLPAVGWGLFVFFTGVLVLLIYYLIARNYPPIGQHDPYARPESVYGGGGGGTMHGAGPVQKETADADFVDEELERLIAAGDLREARAYLRDMMKLAQEMHDPKGAANYRKYERKISEASSRGTRGSYGY